MDFQGTTEMVSEAWEFCQKQQTSLVPRGERQNGALGASSALRLVWRAQPADPLAGPVRPDLARSGGLAGPSRELCFAWGLASEEEFAGCCWPRPDLPALSSRPFPAPHLACTPGVWFVTPVLPASSTSEPGFDLASRDRVSVEDGQSSPSGLRVITRTASQADDSFQPWLISAFWPNGSIRHQSLYPLCDGEPYLLTGNRVHIHTQATTASSKASFPKLSMERY